MLCVDVKRSIELHMLQYKQIRGFMIHCDSISRPLRSLQDFWPGELRSTSLDSEIINLHLPICMPKENQTGIRQTLCKISCTTHCCRLIFLERIEENVFKYGFSAIHIVAGYCHCTNMYLSFRPPAAMAPNGNPASTCKDQIVNSQLNNVID